jgi:uncharacterized protein (DUF934 family)
MGMLIKNRQLAQDNWRLLEAEEGSSIPASGDIIVPLDLWQASWAALRGRTGRVGVWLRSDQGPERLVDQLNELTLVAVSFPKFTDGRGYSIARLLRERYGFKGELRAIGDVQRDQLSLLERCGFDAFELKEGDAEAALSAFAEMSEAYQASVERPQPLFRRRAASAQDGKLG